MSVNRNLKPVIWFSLPVVTGLFVLYALLTGTFPTISGKTGNGDSRGGSMSADGRLIAFVSNDSHNPGGSNSRQDVYVYDNDTGRTLLASTNSGGEPANGNSGNIVLDYPKLSADGGTLIFTSTSSNLVPDVDGGLFIKNLESGEVKVVAAHDDSSQSWDQVVVQDSVSPDGRFVAITSAPGVFVYDSQTGAKTRADIDAGGNDLPGASPRYIRDAPSISANGRFVAFSLVSSLPEKKNGRDLQSVIYVKDMQTGQLITASVDEKGHPFDYSTNAAISADGNLLVFETDGAIQLRDMKIGTNQRLDEGSNPSISGNGRYVVYQRNDTVSNLKQCEKNSHCPNAFLFDLQSGRRKREVVPSDWDTWSRLEPLAVGDNGLIVFTAGASFAGIEAEKCVVDRSVESGGPTERDCSNVYRKDPASGQLTRVSGIRGSTVEPVEEEHPPEFFIMAVQNELRNAAAAEERYFAANNTYTTRPEDLREQGFAPHDGVSLDIATATSFNYCLQARSNSEQAAAMVWSFSNTDGMPTSNTCP